MNCDVFASELVLTVLSASCEGHNKITWTVLSEVKLSYMLLYKVMLLASQEIRKN